MKCLHCSSFLFIFQSFFDVASGDPKCSSKGPGMWTSFQDARFWLRGVALSMRCRWVSLLDQNQDDARRPRTGFRKRSNVMIQCIRTSLDACAVRTCAVRESWLVQAFDRSVFRRVADGPAIRAIVWRRKSLYRHVLTTCSQVHIE